MKVGDEDWNVPAGQLAHSSMPLNRYLEYTNETISVIFRELNEKVLADLKLIPCVLMTEFANERHADGQSYECSRGLTLSGTKTHSKTCLLLLK